MICYLKNKAHVNHIMSEKTQQRLFSSKLFQAPSPNNQRERKFPMSISPKAEEPYRARITIFIKLQEVMHVTCSLF